MMFLAADIAQVEIPLWPRAQGKTNRSEVQDGSLSTYQSGDSESIITRDDTDGCHHCRSNG